MLDIGLVFPKGRTHSKPALHQHKHKLHHEHEHEHHAMRARGCYWGEWSLPATVQRWIAACKQASKQAIK